MYRFGFFILPLLPCLSLNIAASISVAVGLVRIYPGLCVVYGCVVECLLLFCFSPKGLFNALTRRNYSLPTAVQAGAIPCLLKGRDCLCTAQTGSGKTAAYLLPLLARVSHLNENEDWRNKVAVYKGGSEPKKDAALGPTAMVICPTRYACNRQ